MVRIYLRLTIAIILLVSLVGSISCGGGGSPKEVVRDFLQAVNAGEFDKAEQYIDSTLFTSQFPDALEGNIQKIEITDARTFGEGIEMASVGVTLTVSPALYSSSSVWMQEHIMGFALVKSAQDWKITAIAR